jgi:hypothetical protein
MCCGRSATRPSIRSRYDRSSVLKPKLKARTRDEGQDHRREAERAHRGNAQVVVEVAVKDDGRVELLLVLHDGLVRLLGDHGREPVVLGVDVRVEVVDDVRERLLGLLVEVGD